MGNQTRGVSIVGTANITIEVDAAAARAFAEASPGEQQKLQLLLSLRLQELTAKQGGTLQLVMDETGRAAEGRGLTPEILENLLRDEFGDQLWRLWSFDWAQIEPRNHFTGIPHIGSLQAHRAAQTR